MNTRDNDGRGASPAGAKGVSVARRCVISAAVILGLLVPVSHRGDATAQNADLPLPVTLGAGSELWLEGTSTIHDFTSKTTKSSLSLTRSADAQVAPGAAGFEALVRASGVRGLDLEVPVLSLHSEKSGLDKNLWKALKATEHPSIKFHLSKYTILGSATADTLKVRAEGTLYIAGVQRPDTLEAKMYHSQQGMWLAGSEPLLMSEFGIKPPKMMMGTLRVADRITVRYRLLLAPKSETPNSPSSSTN